MLYTLLNGLIAYFGFVGTAVFLVLFGWLLWTAFRRGEFTRERVKGVLRKCVYIGAVGALCWAVLAESRATWFERYAEEGWFSATVWALAFLQGAGTEEAKAHTEYLLNAVNILPNKGGYARGVKYLEASSDKRVEREEGPPNPPGTAIVRDKVNPSTFHFIAEEDLTEDMLGRIVTVEEMEAVLHSKPKRPEDPKEGAIPDEPEPETEELEGGGIDEEAPNTVDEKEQSDAR